MESKAGFFSWLNFPFPGAIFQKIPIAEGNPQQKTEQPGVLGLDFGPVSGENIFTERVQPTNS